MGKSNRIRNNRAAAKAAAPVTKQKKGMPNWLITAITLVLTVAILASVVFGVLDANGVFLRMTKTMESDNYKVSGNMMSYFFYSGYQTFYSNYQSYLTQGYFSLDSTKSLKSQTFGGDGTKSVYDEIFLGEFEGTWFDYFMNQAKTQVKELLVYCEEADARGITLDESELDSIEAELDAIGTYATLYGYPSANSYIAAMYGQGVTKGDVRKALKLTHLASKCADTIVKEFDDALPLDSKDITDEYEKNSSKYDVIDYSYHTFSVNYSAAIAAVVGSDATDAEKAEKKAEIEAKFKELVEEAKADAAELQAITTQDAFEKHILVTHLNSEFDSKFYGIKDELRPGDSIEGILKEKLFAAIIADVVAEKTETTDDAVYVEGSDDATLFEQKVTKAYAEEVFKVKKELFTSLLSKADSYFREDVTYTDSDFFNWAFEKDENSGTRKPYDIKLVESGYKDGDTLNDESYYSANVYMLMDTAAPNSNPTHNLGFATFTTEDEAKAFEEALKAKGETLTFEEFKAVAEEKTALTVDTLDDYAKGEMGVAALDAWAFADGIKVGSYSGAISVDGAYVVFLYTGEGEETWKVTVKNSLLDERVSANYETLAEKYAPVEYPKALNKIEA